MKRLSVFSVLLSVCILVLSVNFVVFAASPIETKSDNTPIEFHDETCLGLRFSPVYYPTDTLLNSMHEECRSVAVMGADVKIAPVFDATGKVVSDPTGTIEFHDETCIGWRFSPVYYPTKCD